MSDSENDLPSDEEEDDDYVPSGEEVQEEASEPDDSEPSDEEDEEGDSGEKRRVGERQSARLKKNEKKAAKASSLKRGRTRRGVPFGGEESNGSGSTETPSKKAKPGPQTEVEEKKRVDDLWASFLSDVNQPKAKPTSKVLVQKGTKVEVEGGDSSSSDLVAGPTSNNSSTGQQQQSTSSASSSPTKSSNSSEKITITKVFDFAGEEIKVTKEVSLDSEEAKEELAKREADTAKTSTSTSAMTTEADSPSSSATPAVAAPAAAAPSPSSATASPTPSAKPASLKTAVLSGPSGSGAVDKILNLGKQKASAASGSPKAGLSNIMDKISGGPPKKKMSVLDKTALDWKNFKDKEGISEELATFNKGKGGYLEKQKFLQQTDYRQYEAERDMRLGKR